MTIASRCMIATIVVLMVALWAKASIQQEVALGLHQQIDGIDEIAVASR